MQNNAQLPITSLRINYAVGIDPDIKGSGFAIYSRVDKVLTRCETLDHTHLMAELGAFVPGQVIFFIDAGWLNGGYFHYANFPPDFNKWAKNAQHAYLVKRGIDVGRNFGVGQFIADFLIGIHGEDNVRPIRPSGTKDPNNPLKWDAAKMKQITGWKGRTNPDSRDAARLCWARL